MDVEVNVVAVPGVTLVARQDENDKDRIVKGMAHKFFKVSNTSLLRSICANTERQASPWDDDGLDHDLSLDKTPSVIVIALGMLSCELVYHDT